LSRLFTLQRIDNEIIISFKIKHKNKYYIRKDINMKNVEFKNDFIIRLREAVKKYKEKNQSSNE
jgi:hypothetical protein